MRTADVGKHDDPPITLTVPGSVLTGIHLVATSVRDQAEAEGLEIYEDLRDTCRAIEGALRSHGWVPRGNGFWEKRGGRHR